MEKPLVYDEVNSRLKVFECTDIPLAISEVRHVMEKYPKYSKCIFYLTREQFFDLEKGSPLQYEATIHGFYDGADALLVALYSGTRGEVAPETHRLIEEVLRFTLNKPPIMLPAFDSRLILRDATEEDCVGLAEIFRNTFSYYADQGVYDPKILARRLHEGTHAYHIIQNTTSKRIAAVASMDMTALNYKSCEISDCVVLPHYQKQNLMQFLFYSLERSAFRKGFRYCFTMTRATSYPMNICARQCGYQMTGTMLNNCHMDCPIAYESMNIWCKPLSEGKL